MFKCLHEKYSFNTSVTNNHLIIEIILVCIVFSTIRIEGLIIILFEGLLLGCYLAYWPNKLHFCVNAQTCTFINNYMLIKSSYYFLRGVHISE